MERISTFGSSNLKCCWHPYIFGTLWTDPRNLHLPMQTPKCWESTKDASRRPSQSSALIWRTTNFCVPIVPKDAQMHRRIFTTLTGCRFGPTSSSFAASFHVQDARGWWLSGPREQGQGTHKSICLFRGTRERRRYCHNIAQAFADIVQILDQSIKGNKRPYDGLRDDMFDARDVETQGKEAPRWGCPWYYDKTKVENHFHAKAQSRAFIAAIHIMLCIFAIK